MRFADLLTAAGLGGALRGGGVEIDDVAIDSRRCGPGTCFVALRGTRADGHDHIASALSAGAAAVVCEDASRASPTAPLAITTDARTAAGMLAQAIRGFPARKLTTVGVTGTNGKTTVAYLVRAILTEAGIGAGLLGTIGFDTGRRTGDAGATTPDPVSLAELTAEMVAAGQTHLVMEVSSHALDQGRTAGLTYRVGVFTNLTGDHLDYHGTMERYRDAKARLFAGLGADATAVINRDDPAGEFMAGATQAQVTWYGLNPLADVRARIERIDSSGTAFDLVVAGQVAPVQLPLIGRHNVYNALAAVSAARAMGVELATSARALSGRVSLPGRLERVAGAGEFDVFVDYAHTDDALANVLGSLRPVTRGRLIVVFGCGGDRDRTKRPRMAQVAQELADEIVLTSDNPRTEPPMAILDEIAAGLDAAGRRRATIEGDRRRAIALAVGRARTGDVVLIAGKGHERVQIVGDEWREFDDVAVTREILEGMQR